MNYAKTMNFEQLETNVLKWAQKRKILKQGTPEAQHRKTEEEVRELKKAIGTDDHAGIIDGIGDVIVTLIIQAALHNLSFEGCLETAWNEIKDRNGKMVDGQFVKDGRTNNGKKK